MTTSSSKVLPAAAAPDEGAVFDADEPELAMLRAEIERLERVAAAASTRGVTKDGLQQGGRAAASADSDPSAAEARVANPPAAELSGADAECKEPGPSGQADSSNAPRVPRIQSSRMFELLQLDVDGKPLEWDSHEHRKVGMPPAAMDSTKTGTTRVATTTAALRPPAQTRYAHPLKARSLLLSLLMRVLLGLLLGLVYSDQARAQRTQKYIASTRSLLFMCCLTAVARGARARSRIRRRGLNDRCRRGSFGLRSFAWGLNRARAHGATSSPNSR